MPEVVKNEKDRTHPNLSPEEERAERRQGVIDAKGRRLPAGRLFILLFVIVMAAVLIYGLLIRPH